MGVETALIVGALVSAGVGAAGAAGAFGGPETPEAPKAPELEPPGPSDAELGKDARRQRILAARRVGADALTIPTSSSGLNIP